jgi:hypothetical protein
VGRLGGLAALDAIKFAHFLAIRACGVDSLSIVPEFSSFGLDIRLALRCSIMQDRRHRSVAVSAAAIRAEELYSCRVSRPISAICFPSFR